MDLLIAAVSTLFLAVLILYIGQRLKIPSIVSFLIMGMLVRSTFPKIPLHISLHTLSRRIFHG